MKNILIPVLLSLIGFTGVSQVSYHNRIEIELNDGYIGESLTEFGEEGFMILSRSKKDVKNMFEWRYEQYDTDLEHVNQKTILLNKSFYKDESFDTETFSHTLYRDKKGNYSIVSVEAFTMEVTQVNGALPGKTILSDMAILEDFAIFIGKMSKESFLVAINWKTGKLDIVPIEIQGYKQKQIYVSRFQVLKEAQEVFAYVKVQVSKKVSELYVVRLNDEGEREDMFKLESETGENLISISASKVDEDQYVFTGSYSTISTISSEGIFFMERLNGKTTFMNFFKYTDLDDFLSYLSDKSQQKIEKKKQKKEKKGKELKISYNLANHEIIKVEDGYIFLGEAFYPTYRTETYTTTDANGRTTTHTRSVFDGYQYTHAVIVKFSEEGEILWDKTFEMWASYKPYYVKRFISISERNEGSMDMVFANRSYIVSKSIEYDEGLIEEGKENKKIETIHSGDDAKYSVSNIDYWYDNYFIAYGTQVIKNTSGQASKKKRKIYFISKVEY